jgi:hypothetical protein
VGPECQRLDHIGAAADAAVHQHLQAIADCPRDFRQLPDAGSHAIQLPPAVIGDDDPVRRRVRSRSRVFRGHDALDDQLSRPQRTQPLDIPPRDRRIELGVDQCLVGFEVVRISDLVAEVSEPVRLPLDRHIEKPARTLQQLHRLGQRGSAQHAVLRVPVAHSRNRQVHGKQQRGAPGGGCTLQKRLHQAPIAQHVELEPAGLGHGSVHLFDRADTDRGYGEGHPCGRRGPGRLDLAAARHHARHADRRQRQRHADAGAAKLRCRIDTTHVAHDPLL